MGTSAPASVWIQTSILMLTCFWFSSHSLATTFTTPQIAIIIDDLGYNKAYGERAINLPGPLTFAVIPFAPNSKVLAERAYFSGNDVMLHMPMQSSQGKDIGLGGINASHTRDEVKSRLRKSLNELPFAIGMNNHMGSLLTTNPNIMGWIMEELTGTTLFFVDSYTTADSVAHNTAKAFGVPTLKRDVFLDSEDDAKAIDKQFMRLVRKAKEQGYALAIGHPRPATLEVLERRLKQLKELGVKLVSVADMVIVANNENPGSGQGISEPPNAPQTLALLPVDRKRKPRAPQPRFTWRDVVKELKDSPSPTPARVNF